MYLDISSNQGKIDWQEMREKEFNINGIILRATTKNNKLDVRLVENYNGILHNMSDINELSVYKFSYARDYITARRKVWTFDDFHHFVNGDFGIV